jgi:1-acyl-sn-glycerol-3-phosphate acyltransferase
LKPLGYYWRLVATGYNFAVFGLGGLLTAIFVMPLVHVWPGNAEQRNARARQVVHYLFRYFVWQMRVTGVITLTVNDVERLRHQAPGRLVVVNHPSLIDVVLVVSLLPYSCCVVKNALWRNPLLGGVIRSAGYISNADSARNFLGHSARVLRAGYPIVMFPEGTRTVPGADLRFQRGAANIAVRNGVSVLPVVVRCDPPTLRKHERWYQIPARRADFSVTVHEPVDPASITDASRGPAVETRQFNRWLEKFYRGELQT